MVGNGTTVRGSVVCTAIALDGPASLLAVWHPKRSGLPASCRCVWPSTDLWPFRRNFLVTSTVLSGTRQLFDEQSRSLPFKVRKRFAQQRMAPCQRPTLVVGIPRTSYSAPHPRCEVQSPARCDCLVRQRGDFAQRASIAAETHKTNAVFGSNAIPLFDEQHI